ncbi:MAG TPA: electron transport complex subunit RsxG [Povalibacter sp.]
MNADSPGARPVSRSVAALIIVGAAIVLCVVLAFVADHTHDRIARNEQAWVQQRLDALVPAGMHDNDLLTDRIHVTAPDILDIAEPVTIYRARLGSQPIAAILHTVAPDGYHGRIELLVAIAHEGTLIGVQIVRHHETPGLGDQFENRRRDWLADFRGRSLSNPPQQRWSVRKDGGDFDAFTGATITPRAIVRATRRALEYYAARRDLIFAAASTP